MPRPALPPTPASSTEIKGRDGSQMGFSQMSFELPPSAFEESRPSSADTKSSSASSYHPTSPKSAPQPRRRSSAATANPSSKDVFALPPPPSRSRKIIQMKPKGQDDMGEVAEAEKNSAAPKQTPSKKKTPSATSAAGRKIARKTAHSLIERRRRSKMNEEFGVLKNMIPACTGEMHKLAILQASIDYVRYLEDCVSKLKTQNGRSTPTAESQHEFTPPAARENNYDIEDDDDEDVEMAGSENPSPAYTPAIAPHQQSISPVILAQDSHYRQNSYATSTSSHQDNRHYSYSSSTTSPAFGPQRYEYAASVASIGSALTSPALLPQRAGERDLDHEATAALLMLNSDRRGTTDRGRGMSVKDLLSA